jgi:hypothetical protein
MVLSIVEGLTALLSPEFNRRTQDKLLIIGLLGKEDSLPTQTKIPLVRWLRREGWFYHELTLIRHE